MTILFALFSALLMLGLPIGLGFYLKKRINPSWKLFWIGAAVFVFSQIGHIPFNAFIMEPFLARTGMSLDKATGWILVLVSILYGLSAGVFEECSRWLMYRFWTKKVRSYSEGFMLGAGHGGVESMVLGGLALAALIQMIALRGADLSTMGFPSEQLPAIQANIDAYWATPWHQFLLAPLERIFAMTFHIAASLLVLNGFRKKNHLWLLAAILWHTVLDALAVYLMMTTSAYVVEGAVFVVTLGSLWIIFSAKKWMTVPENQDEFLTEAVSDDENILMRSQNIEDVSIQDVEGSQYE
ncbi:MAG: YhfC family intramembrane metalloprotease [Anaerolineales bacterium]|nr:YhfC family intramembrane metalloprotease [Anaerolineales bacterium]